MPTTASTSVTTTCSQDGCRRPRAVVLVKDKQYRARECPRHLPRKLKSRVVRPDSTGPKNSTHPRCKARLRSGGRCGRPAGAGTDHPGYGTCKLHGGSTPNAGKNAAKKEMAAQAVVMGMPVDIDPMEALLQCVRIAAGEVIYATQQVAQLEASEATVTAVEVKTRPMKDMGGAELHETAEERTESTDAKLHIWISTRQGAMDRLARYSKMAIDAGIAERQVAIAEKVGGLMGRMVRGILDDLGLTDSQEASAPLIVQRHMTVLEGAARELETGKT